MCISLGRVVWIFSHRKKSISEKPCKSYSYKTICYTKKIRNLIFDDRGRKYRIFCVDPSDFGSSKLEYFAQNHEVQNWNLDISAHDHQKTSFVFFLCSKLVSMDRICRVLRKSIFFDVKKFTQLFQQRISKWNVLIAQISEMWHFKNQNRTLSRLWVIKRGFWSEELSYPSVKRNPGKLFPSLPLSVEK